MNGAVMTHFSYLLINTRVSTVCKGAVSEYICIITLHGIEDKVQWSDPDQVSENRANVTCVSAGFLD